MLKTPTGTRQACRAYKARASIGLLELPTAFYGPLAGWGTVLIDDEFRVQIARGAAVGWDDFDAVANLNHRILPHSNLHMLFGAITCHLAAGQILDARSKLWLRRAYEDYCAGGF